MQSSNKAEPDQEEARQNMPPTDPYIREIVTVQQKGVADAKAINAGNGTPMDPWAAIRRRFPGEEPKTYIEVLSPSQILDYSPPEGTILVGDNHLVRGNFTILGGPPGVGKSRASVALAVAGATKQNWFGYPVHCNFKTLIIQNENGRSRLKAELAEINCPELEKFLRITPPPAYGLCFWKDEFRDQLRKIYEEFGPATIVLDPWNAVTRDDKQKDYLETFDIIRRVFPAGDDGCSILILPHTRKPLPGERANGRALLNLLAGSYSLGSVPRTAFILQHASDDVTETRVVLTCCKNNDGQLGHRSVWLRKNGLFQPITNFNWDNWDNPNSKQANSGISQEAVAAVFENGLKRLSKNEAAGQLQAITKRSKSAAYNALDLYGRFGEHFDYDKKTKLYSRLP